MDVNINLILRTLMDAMTRIYSSTVAAKDEASLLISSSTPPLDLVERSASI